MNLLTICELLSWNFAFYEKAGKTPVNKKSAKTQVKTENLQHYKLESAKK